MPIRLARNRDNIRGLSTSPPTICISGSDHGFIAVLSVRGDAMFLDSTPEGKLKINK